MEGGGLYLFATAVAGQKCSTVHVWSGVVRLAMKGSINDDGVVQQQLSNGAVNADFWQKLGRRLGAGRRTKAIVTKQLRGWCLTSSGMTFSSYFLIWK